MKPAAIRVAPPWRVNVSKLVRPGENRIEVLVYNTLANHYLTIPTGYRAPLTSGLLGPVTIEVQKQKAVALLATGKPIATLRKVTS